MHHYFEAITNTSGDSLVGYFARVIDPVTQNTVTMSADDNGTPIVTKSGVDNMGSTDDYGNLDFYVVPGTYHLDIYAPNATSFIFRVPNVAMNSSKGDPGEIGPAGVSDATFLTLTDLKAINPSTYPSPRLAAVTGSSGGVANGPFIYQTGAFTGRTDVVFLNTDPTGVNGALVRQAADGIGYGLRTAKARLDDEVCPLDLGAVGDGSADDTAAINAALAKGRTVIFPRGYTFKTRGNHSLATNSQRIIVDGTIIHDGVRRDLGGVFGYDGIFLVQDYVDGVTFTGSGTLDGMRASFSSGDRGSGIQAWRATNIKVDGLRFTAFIDDGVKAHNCPNTVVTRATRFDNIHNAGIELRSYANDPRNGSPWVGPVSGPSGNVDGMFSNINDFLHGAGNGCGVDFSPPDAGAPNITQLRVSGVFNDCLRGIFAENNHPDTVSVTGVVIDSPIITGSIAGATTNETKDGIGLINCQKVKIINPIMRNIGNYSPVGGDCAGIQVSGPATQRVEIINPVITETRTTGARTDYGIHVAALTNGVTIKGGSLVGSFDDAPTLIDPTATNIRVEGLEGAPADMSWGYTQQFTFIVGAAPVSSTTPLLWQGLAGHDAAILQTPGRVVAVTARLPGAFTGSLSLQVTVGGVNQPLGNTATPFYAVPPARFAGATAISAIGTVEALSGAKSAQIKVSAITDAAFSTPTVPIIVVVTVDYGIKQ